MSSTQKHPMIDLDIKLRERAVENVDRRHGYTMEFAPSPSQHRAKYAEEEARLRLEAADDPGAWICGHAIRAERLHYLGGGLYVCFACFAKLVTGSRA